MHVATELQPTACTPKAYSTVLGRHKSHVVNTGRLPLLPCILNILSLLSLYINTEFSASVLTVCASPTHNLCCTQLFVHYVDLYFVFPSVDNSRYAHVDRTALYIFSPLQHSLGCQLNPSFLKEWTWEAKISRHSYVGCSETSTPWFSFG